MESSVYRDYQIELGKGDKIFVYTDGVPEATNHDKEMFGTDRMIESLNNNAKADPKGILTAVRESVDNFVGGTEQFGRLDDALPGI